MSNYSDMVEIPSEELRLLRWVASASYDLRRARLDAVYRDRVGGIKAMEDEHDNAVKSWENYVEEHDEP